MFDFNKAQKLELQQIADKLPSNSTIQKILKKKNELRNQKVIECVNKIITKLMEKMNDANYFEDGIYFGIEELGELHTEYDEIYDTISSIFEKKKINYDISYDRENKRHYLMLLNT